MIKVFLVSRSDSVHNKWMNFFSACFVSLVAIWEHNLQQVNFFFFFTISQTSNIFRSLEF